MERFKDINAQKVVMTNDDQTGKVIQLEVYGEQLDGTPTWIMCHVAPNAEFKVQVATDD